MVVEGVGEGTDLARAFNSRLLRTTFQGGLPEGGLGYREGGRRWGDEGGALMREVVGVRSEEMWMLAKSDDAAWEGMVEKGGVRLSTGLLWLVLGLQPRAWLQAVPRPGRRDGRTVLAWARPSQKGAGDTGVGGMGEQRGAVGRWGGLWVGEG